MNWLWLNVPLMAVFFLAVAGIPLWLVLRRPDFSVAPADAPCANPVALGADAAGWPDRWSSGRRLFAPELASDVPAAALS